MSGSPLRFTVCPHAVDLTLRDCAMCNNKLRAERDELLAALRDIANPLTKLREQAQEAGCVLDGAMVVQLVNDPHWLREKAKAAVAAAERLAGDKTDA